MTYGQLNAVIDETSLSPESLAPIFSVANMTIRRWQKSPSNKKVSEVDQWNIIQCIYKLVLEGKLKTDSPAVRQILKNSTPASFLAITKGLGAEDVTGGSSTDQQDRMTLLLAQIGGDESHKKHVDDSGQKLTYFKKMGSEWHKRITGLLHVVRSKKLSTFDKVVAYGALFYLITPLDLIPDHIPVIGLIDDFGVLGFATAYYLKRFPEIADQV